MTKALVSEYEYLVASCIRQYMQHDVLVNLIWVLLFDARLVFGGDAVPGGRSEPGNVRCVRSWLLCKFSGRLPRNTGLARPHRLALSRSS